MLLCRCRAVVRCRRVTNGGLQLLQPGDVRAIATAVPRDRCTDVGLYMLAHCTLLAFTMPACAGAEWSNVLVVDNASQSQRISQCRTGLVRALGCVSLSRGLHPSLRINVNQSVFALD